MSRTPKPLSSSTFKIVVRDPDNYPDSLKFVLDIVTINETPNVVGSAKYMGMSYASDVDVFEDILMKTNKKEAVELYANLIATIASEIAMTDRKILFNGFKAGMDNRYSFEMTEHTKKNEAAVELNKLCAKNLIDHDKHKELNSLLCKGDWKEFNEQIRLLRTIRWTVLELIEQKKHLTAGKSMTLQEAIAMPSLVKLDVISYIESKVQAIQDLGDYMVRMKEDFDRYSSVEEYNPLKLMKRLWAFSNFIHCGEIVKLLLPLYRSDMSALNQVVADIEIMRDLVTKQEQIPTKTILIESAGFKKRMFNHLDVKGYRRVHSHLDGIIRLWVDYENGRKFDKNTFLQLINELEQYLKPIIKKISNDFLKKAILEFNKVRCRPIDL